MPKKKNTVLRGVASAPAFDVAALSRATEQVLKAVHAADAVFSDTPKRVATMWGELLERQLREPLDIVKRTVPTTLRDLVFIGPVHTHSMCPHHLLPCDVIAHVGIIPDGRTAGLSNLAELIAVSTRRFALVEDLPELIAADVQATLSPRGVAVHLQSRHGCVAFRGSKRQETWFDVQAFFGACDSSQRRREFLLSVVAAQGAPAR